MKKILTIDDSVVDNMINEIILRRTFPDHEIIVYEDPTEAMSYIRSNKEQLPSIILLDLNMPVVSGWDLIEELSTYQASINVFMLTSSIFKEDEARARRYACVKDYFVKPLDIKMAEGMKTHLPVNNEPA